MMECKKALTEANGDINAAAEAMRKSGAAKADKRLTAWPPKAVCLAQDGGKAVLVEVNSKPTSSPTMTTSSPSSTPSPRCPGIGRQ